MKCVSSFVTSIKLMKLKNRTMWRLMRDALNYSDSRPVQFVALSKMKSEILLLLAVTAIFQFFFFAGSQVRILFYIKLIFSLFYLSHIFSFKIKQGARIGRRAGPRRRRPSRLVSTDRSIEPRNR